MSDYPPLFMIHGAFCGGWCFSKLERYFNTQGYDCEATTLPFHEPKYHGHPDSVLGGLSLADYVDFLEKELDKLEEEPILIGHSMGGLLVQMLAARGRGIAGALLAPCAPWGVLPTTVGEYANAFGIAMMSPASLGEPLIPNFTVAVDQSLHQLSVDEQKSIFGRFVPESGRATFEIFHWGFDMWRVSHVPARKVKIPLLTISGGRDRINPPSTVKRVSRRYNHPLSQYLKMDDMSHWLIGEEGWEEVASAIHNWISALPLEQVA